MHVRSRRTVFYLGLVVATTALFTVLYNLGMAVLEGHPQPLYRSLQVVIQSFTTTGYGEDAPWQSPLMNLLAILMQLAGIGLILTAVDVFAVPWLREALSPSAPESVDGVADHVVVCGYTPRTAAFVSELDAREQDAVIVEPDPELAGELHEDDHRVISGDPESTETLRNASLDTAQALVADVSDEANASIALAAREVSSDAQVVTLVEDADLADYHRIAGADDVLSPRQLLGASLASELPTAVTAHVGEGITIGEDFELRELAIQPESELSQQTVTSAQLRERFGVNVIGAWVGSEFESPVDPDRTLTAATRLLVAGESEHISALQEQTSSTVQAFTDRHVIVAGYGDSGQAAAQALADTSTQVTVLDVEAGDQVDVAGDARDPAVLEAAGIDDASGLIVTVSDDTTAIFVTLVARDMNPSIQIVVRANEEANVGKLYRAGADYVQSLATVSGRMLASTVFEDEAVVAYGAQIEVVRVPAAGLAGQTLVEAAVRTVTGCTVVAVIRGGETITDFDPATFRLNEDDAVILAGTDEDVAAFEREFGT